jgi:hypothetical protein
LFDDDGEEEREMRAGESVHVLCGGTIEQNKAACIDNEPSPLITVIACRIAHIQ